MKFLVCVIITLFIMLYLVFNDENKYTKNKK